MKKSVLILALFLSVSNIFANNPLSPVVAQVKLTKTELIKLDYLESKIQQTEKQYNQVLTNELKDQVLDSLINNELMMQAATRDGIIISEDMILNMLRQQAGPGATDDQIKDALSAQYQMSWPEALEGLINQFTLQEYIKKAGAEEFKKYATNPTEDQIVDFYNANKTKFINPDMIRVNHIFFRTTGKSDLEINDAKAKADAALASIKSGEKSFNELVAEVSEDEKSKENNGELGFITRDNPAHVQLLGNDFLNATFKLPMEGVHGVLKSNAGFHIIVITEKRSARFLNITDPIDPSNPSAGTVAQIIAQNLQQQVVANAFAQVTEIVIEDIRKEAVIKIIDQSIPWKK